MVSTDIEPAYIIGKNEQNVGLHLFSHIDLLGARWEVKLGEAQQDGKEGE